MPSIKLTKSSIDNIQYSDKTEIYWDTLFPSFGLRVGRKSKVFIVQSRINGMSKRIKIGNYGTYTLEQARDKARKYLYKMSNDQNPLHERKSNILTLLEAFNEHTKTRDLTHNTLRDYKCVIDNYLVDWQNIPIKNITKQMVVERHLKIGKHSPARANMAMRVLKAVLNSARKRHGDDDDPIIINNPVEAISPFKIHPRISVIAPEELPALFMGLQKIESDTVRNYILLLLLTGLRREEGARIKWEHVDFRTKTLTIYDTKNHIPLIIPLSNYLFCLFKRRHEYRINEYVFPSKNGKGHLINIHCQIARIKELSIDPNIKGDTGISFTLHDFRRTYITIAESLGISPYTYKQLANHKLPANDMTARYVNLNLEQKRKAQQKITNYILRKAGVRPKAEVVDFNNRATETLN
jgi:integrase